MMAHQVVFNYRGMNDIVVARVLVLWWHRRRSYLHLPLRMRFRILS